MSNHQLKTKFFGGWEVYFENKDKTVRFFKTQGVTYRGFEFFKKFSTALEMEINGDIINKIYMHRGEEKKLVNEMVELPIKDWEEHDVFF